MDTSFGVFCSVPKGACRKAEESFAHREPAAGPIPTWTMRKVCGEHAREFHVIRICTFMP